MKKQFSYVQGFSLLFLAWTILLAGLLYWNVRTLKRTTLELARHDARVTWERDILYRFWAAERGGVYAPMDKKTPANPYLKVPNRDINIAGKDFTLVNPAYMTRQIYELAQERSSIKGHITSLKPIKPENAPDPWEAKALRKFEQGHKECSKLVNIDNHLYMRLMRPFITKKPCLKCHAFQGYKEGDIRGGISITIPMDDYFTEYNQKAGKFYITYFLIYLIGLITILITVGRQKILEKEQLRARKNAEAAAAAKTTFLANMSHDIRTPLNGIIGILNLTLEQDLPVTQRKHLASAKDSADFLYGLLNNILDISKIEAHQFTLDETTFSLVELLVDIESIFMSGVSEKQLQFQALADKTIPSLLYGDSLRLRQVLINLIGNAIKFTTRGKISVRAQLQTLQEKKAVIHFSVADEGIGIPQEKQTTIFDSFSQADSSTTRKFGGTGLGLAICKHLTEMMGGKIWLESQEGEGATFHFTAGFAIGELDRLPSPAPNNPAENQKTRSFSILLVEDNELNREVAIITLKNAGHQVDSVVDGVEALKILLEKSFDAILMDVQMPVMDGLTATRFIRACERGKVIDSSAELNPILEQLSKLIKHTYTPIIALTANAMSEDRDQCLNVGMDDYLSKPFQPNQVISTLRRLCKGLTGKHTDEKN